MADRAVVFVDGNNWYHSLIESGWEHPGRLDLGKLSRKFLGPREWIGTRYCIGRVSREGRPRLYADQRRFLANLQSTDRRISVHLGRLEKRRIKNGAAVMLAVDMVTMAERDEYDAAYLLSADGDYTPAVAAVRSHGKKVYAASPAKGAQLAAAASSFIPLKADWFDDCT